jgi:2-keto-3-deoxy-L-rhamnonate aldolase RhmA
MILMTNFWGCPNFANFGQDWFVIDMEHSPNELNDVLLQLQAGHMTRHVSVVKLTQPGV